MSARRHLLILLMLTVLIRGLMFISYPMGGQGEAQGYHRYAVSQILAGDLQVSNLQIGNLRHAPGYPLLIAPIAAIGDLFGRFDDRIELLFQIALSATIPFLLYDILRTRHSPRAAFLVALLSISEPFSLQWAHFSLPVWLAALCLVFALWLLHHAERRRSARLVVAAGLVAGLGVLARWNFALVAAGLGLLLLFSPRAAIRRRLRHLALFGASGALLVLLVFVAVQLPATGVWNPSCVSSVNLVELLILNGVPLRAEHGPQSERLFRLASLAPLPEQRKAGASFLMWHAGNFPNWQTPGPWSTAAERQTFLSQPAAPAAYSIDRNNIHDIFDWPLFYLGPCELDALLRAVYFETISRQTWRWLRALPADILETLTPPLSMETRPGFTLPAAASLAYEASGPAGFQRAQHPETKYYTGQWVWRPGIELFSLLWAPLNALRMLALPALLWALFTKRRVYTALAALLLLYATTLALIDNPDARVYAIVYPLAPALAGGLLTTVWERWRGRAAL